MKLAIIRLLGPFAILAAFLAIEANAVDRAAFTTEYCTGCHDAATKEGGLDLTEIGFELDEPENFSKWVQIHDRVAKGEINCRICRFRWRENWV